MTALVDGPSSSRFAPLSLQGNVAPAALARAGASEEMAKNAKHAPTGQCVAWGIPFDIGRLIVLKDRPVEVRLRPVRAKWLIFNHTSDWHPPAPDEHGLISPMTGNIRMAEHAATYIVRYADGREERLEIRRGFQLGRFARWWGENPVESVADGKPHALAAEGAATIRLGDWARQLTRNTANDMRPWTNWLWAWENPRPGKPIVGLRLEPVAGVVVVSGVSAGDTDEHPLRWRKRRKAVLTLPKGVKFEATLDAVGRLKQVQLDLGQVISARPRPVYPQRNWEKTYNNCPPAVSEREVIVEYAAHPQARFHLPGLRRAPFGSEPQGRRQSSRGKTVSVAKVEQGAAGAAIRPVPASDVPVTLKVVDKATAKCVPVKLHVHGQAGEYLAPTDRQRLPNTCWVQDFNPDFANQNVHFCTYIDGRTDLRLPPGRVFVEVSRGFEIRPVRKVFRVARGTRQLVIELEKVLPWREKGWVSADTHVHVLSPPTALLEGSGEGVNVVNLLATQWGEMMTNVGDFDGKTIFGARDFGGDGEHLVRVGTENRQHVLGHISLLGYNAPIIAPMTTAGGDESALGDPLDMLMTEWARQCRRQDGLVVMPHHPSPRVESAACILDGSVDGVEMTSWGNLYGGIDPYSLSDWYRFLNCGYLTAAVGGTDKMSSATAVGTVRTYARLAEGQEFTYDAWKQAVRRARTFVTYGPLLEFSVEGKPAGSRLEMTAAGGTVSVDWELASVTIPMSKVELVVNGVIRASQAVAPWRGAGNWSIKLDRSCWLALLVRGHYADRPEIIAAHSSPVMAEVGGTPFLAAADAVTILDQLEGALAYLDVLGTRAETAAYKRMRLVLTGAHRGLHNRLHQRGRYHRHGPLTDHPKRR